ncbi:hydroxyacid dehydrogenase [Microbacterium sp. ABRD28]|uniref:hydroxyacid dehydrogenase n=1 Tax=Microbacterium sp. ABRD28 TaxID=2268461 RepID=UPI000F55030C|nr:hydroxyacid dehydrogenase [Microbacterium sp. ABRD28]AZC14013.1 3-phosphoglycerate dehydrogenase [Microbacterium sp. ABRD28]
MSATTIVAAVPADLMDELFDETHLDSLGRMAGQLGGGPMIRVDDLWCDLDMQNCVVLLTSWGTPRLTSDILDRFPSLRLVAHTGASVRPFVSDALFERGILVTQSGAGMARSVAEVSLAFTLALLHRIPQMHDEVRGGGWGSSGPQNEILDAPIAVIGASRTGRAYLNLLHAVGARPVVVDPTLGTDDAKALGAELVSLDTALTECSIVALHAPSLPQTRHLIGARELALMPDGAGVVNTARSWLIDERALVAEVSSGRLFAAVDVFDEEPLSSTSPFRTLPGVLITPHRAAGTVQCRRRQGRIIIDEIASFLNGAPLRHAVDLTSLAVMA